MNSKKIIAAFIIIAAVVMGLYFLFLFLMPNKPKAVKPVAKPERLISPAAKQTIASSTMIAPQIIQTRPGELPQNFPPTLPLYGKEKIQESYEADYQGSAEGQAARQASVVFASDKSIKDNYDYYIKWAKDNNWQITNQADSETIKFIYLKKGGEDVNITIVSAAGDETKARVSISYVKF